MKLICEYAGRLDSVLSKMLNEPRNRVLELIKMGLVSVISGDGDDKKTVLKPSYAVKMGETIFADIKEHKTPINAISVATSMLFDEIKILFEDDDILIINKPAGLTVHPAPSVKEPTLCDWLKINNFTLSTLAGSERAGIVHRLDKGTSGAMAIAKTNLAHTALSTQLENRSMGRIYLALSDLALKEDLIVDKPIIRHPTNRLKYTVLDSFKARSGNGVSEILPHGARAAKSAFINLFINGKTAPFHLIAAKLFTGRTHQIRVHLASINRHILNDELYNPKAKPQNSSRFKQNPATITRFFLHAYAISLAHPRSHQELCVMAPLPRHFMELLDKYYSKEAIDEALQISHINAIFRALFDRLRD